MGEAKQRKGLGLEPRTVRLPALTQEELHVLHHLMHHRLDELQAAGGEAPSPELQALAALHHKLFGH